jgi:C4-dicarboxylate-specific signal transduction histidine kinase
LGIYEGVMMSTCDYPQRSKATVRQLDSGPVRGREAATVEGLTAAIAHEFGQPLNSLHMNIEKCLQALKAPFADVPVALSAVERAARDSNHLKAIVKTMRQHVLQVEPVDLGRAISLARGLLEHDIVSSLATVRVHICDNLPGVWGDEQSVVQILVNLMTNGLEAMSSLDDDFRELRISAKPTANDEVALAIWDSGEGIADDVMRDMFYPFYTTKRGGKGIGLAICRSLIDSMGGTISAKNHEAGGAYFECRFLIAS